MKKAKLFLVSLFFSLMILVPVRAFAFDPFAKACDGSAEANSSSVCQEKAKTNPNPIYGKDGIINKVANILAAIAAVVAIVIIMLSGMKLIMSSGDSQKLSEARNAIIYASIGLVVIALARIIVGFIVGFV